MSALVLAAIAAELAALERVVPTPTAPFGYGTDISCTTDIEEPMRDVDPFSREALVQRLVRRLDTPRRSLPDDPNYGISLRSYLNRGTTNADIVAIAGQVRAEVLKDDALRDASVTVTFPNGTSKLLVRLVLTAIDPEIGVFTLTLAATDAGLLIEELLAA